MPTENASKIRDYATTNTANTDFIFTKRIQDNSDKHTCSTSTVYLIIIPTAIFAI